MDKKIFETAAEQPEAERYLGRVSRYEPMRALRATALELLPVPPGGRALDMGCGLGDMARVLAGLVGPGGSVTAVDLSPAMVAAAQGKHLDAPGAATVTYQVGDVSTLDRPQEFDVIWCERVLQHVPDPDAALLNLTRALAPGGRLCVIDVDWGALVVDGVDEALTSRVLTAFQRKVAQPTIGRTLRRRFARAGLADPALRAVTVISTVLADAAAVTPVLDRRLSAHIPEADREAWFAALSAADERAEFMAAMPIYVAAAGRDR
ncbi:methyltransferase domain-containing protein [Nonomuraea sp. NPDC046802]|uniref:methyltransferase n=1 Tax=Nonomuraea sp. NPDC046802 TaxID=3154919 RepID=UPI0033C10A3D